ICDRDRHADTDGDLASGRDDLVEVATQQRALGQDGEGCAGVDECVDDRGHQLVAALRTLVRVGVRPERHQLVAPRAPGKLLPEYGGDVGLHHDLVVEVTPGVEVQPFV